MSTTICLVASTLYYRQGGGHFWVYLNWALGLQSNGCRVIWLEAVNLATPLHELHTYVTTLKNKLAPYGLADNVALRTHSGKPLPKQKLGNCMDLDTAIEKCDLLLNQKYSMPSNIIKRFRRSALLDIDPGLLQMWATRKLINISPHDIYFTIGETVGQPGAYFPNCGIEWHYTPPCVSLEWWPVTPAPRNAPFTTVTHWDSNLWEEENGQAYPNNKKAGFLPFLNLPRHTQIPLELALLLHDCNEGEREELEQLGWRVCDSHGIASTPADYQRYIQQSRGEFSCVKPSCVHLQNAWISDRTICYLASGKPAVVQHTGVSRFLPDDAGLLRFKNVEEAVRCLEKVAGDYDKHCSMARSLAEEYFDAKKVTASVLERALA